MSKPTTTAAGVCPPWVALPLADPTEAAVYDELQKRLAANLGPLDYFVQKILEDRSGGRCSVRGPIVRYVLRGILANRGHAATFDRVVGEMDSNRSKE